MNAAAVRHVGRYVEFPCDSCSAPLTALELPGPDGRFCPSCKPVPDDAPSGSAIGDFAQAELWLRKAAKCLDARDVDGLEIAAEQAIDFGVKAVGRQRRWGR